MAGSKKENIWLNLGFNILVPTLLLIKGRKIWERFAEVPDGADFWIFVVALAFPLAYGIYDLASRRKWNLFSIIGVLSVALTGGIGLMKFSREWMIVKEGAVPLMLGAAVLVTAATKKPLAKIIMMNESVLSSVLNFALASYIFKSETGTAEFNAEVGRMTALSFPVIVLPTMVILMFAMFRLFGAITRLTGLSLDEAMAQNKKEK